MAIKSPKERVYYYECSYGKYRLSLHIPYNILLSLTQQNEIDPKVLEEYSDGVDLRVGETDYQDFHESYGYRPKVDPETAKTLFYTILTSTKDWRKYRGTDLISAKELEGKITGIKKTVDNYADLMKISPEEIKCMARADADAPQDALKTYRESRKLLYNEEKNLETTLRRHTPREIDPNKTLREQRFKIQYTQGDSIDEVISRIQRKGRKPS
jgi:hypothetical protein